MPHSAMITMYHYYWKENNKIVVQNIVGGHMGQLHKHTPEDFERWKKGIKSEHLINQDEKKIKCKTTSS